MEKSIPTDFSFKFSPLKDDLFFGEELDFTFWPKEVTQAVDDYFDLSTNDPPHTEEEKDKDPIIQEDQMIENQDEFLEVHDYCLESLQQGIEMNEMEEEEKIQDAVNKDMLFAFHHISEIYDAAYADKIKMRFLSNKKRFEFKNSEDLLILIHMFTCWMYLFSDWISPKIEKKLVEDEEEDAVLYDKYWRHFFAMNFLMTYFTCENTPEEIESFKKSMMDILKDQNNPKSIVVSMWIDIFERPHMWKNLFKSELNATWFNIQQFKRGEIYHGPIDICLQDMEEGFISNLSNPMIYHKRIETNNCDSPTIISDKKLNELKNQVSKANGLSKVVVCMYCYERVNDKKFCYGPPTNLEAEKITNDKLIPYGYKINLTEASMHEGVPKMKGNVYVFGNFCRFMCVVQYASHVFRQHLIAVSNYRKNESKPSDHHILDLCVHHPICQNHAQIWTKFVYNEIRKFHGPNLALICTDIEFYSLCRQFVYEGMCWISVKVFNQHFNTYVNDFI